MDREPYSAEHITVLSFQDAVRMRTGMYFGVGPDSPDLATNILRGVIDDALHPVGGGDHRTVDVEVTADLCFTVTEDQPPTLDDLGEPKRGWNDTLFDRSRWTLGSAAALSSRTVIEVRADGRGWRQELTGTSPNAAAKPFAAPGSVDGTRVTFELDAAFLTPGSVISTSPERLRAPGTRCETCADSPQTETATIRDRRLQDPSAPEL